jgi:tRNA modification GTPase
MLGDTIVARASAAGGSERAVLRVSGPRARAVAARVFAPELPARRAVVEGRVRVPAGELPAMALVMMGPASFTGEDVVELHVPGSMALVQMLLDELLADGAATGVRMALPGEFTARAVQHGKLDAASAEGLLLLLHAEDARAAAAAQAWLSGAAADETRALRAQLQDALALLEAGLDFDDGEAAAVPDAAWRALLAPVRERLGALAGALPAARPGGEALLLGASNAGKSSLANALAGADAALVADAPGTTRDVLRIPLPGGGALWDAPGDLDAPGALDAAALALRDRVGGAAAACLCVLDAARPQAPTSALVAALPCLGVVWTKCDLAPPPPLPAALAGRLPPGTPTFATSARTGAGIETLRGHLAVASARGAVDAGGPLRTALGACVSALDRALAGAAGPETAAVDLQEALRALDAIAGTHSPEDLLDRIYARFCLGK